MSASLGESDGGADFALAAVGIGIGPAEPREGALLVSLLPLMFMLMFIFMKASAALETASLIFSIALSLSMSKAKSIQSPVNWERLEEQIQARYYRTRQAGGGRED